MDEPTDLPPILAEFYAKYAHLDAKTGNRRYLRAVESLIALHQQLGRDESLVDSYLEAIIDDYEQRQREMLDLLLNKELNRLTLNVQEMLSGLRAVIGPSAVQEAVKMEQASKNNDFALVAKSWFLLQQKLYPTFSVLRRFAGRSKDF